MFSIRDPIVDNSCVTVNKSRITGPWPESGTGPGAGLGHPSACDHQVKLQEI